MRLRGFVFVSFFFILLSATAGISKEAKPLKIPPGVYNKILWDIQHQMTYASKNETTVLLWTPQHISLQDHEAEHMPSLSFYAPNEILRTLHFDVSMGHNMDASDIYWRNCQAQVTQIDSTWGQPYVVCDTTAP